MTTMEQLETARITRKLETLVSLPTWLVGLLEINGFVLDRAESGTVAEYNHLVFAGPAGTIRLLTGIGIISQKGFQAWALNGREIGIEQLVAFLEG